MEKFEKLVKKYDMNMMSGGVGAWLYSGSLIEELDEICENVWNPDTVVGERMLSVNEYLYRIFPLHD